METAKYLAEQQRIARIAFQLFAKTGYSKTPLSVIGDAAGVQKSLLQYYFPKKAKFIELFIETSISVLIEHMTGTLVETVGDVPEDFDAVDPFEDDEEEGLTATQLLELVYELAYFEFWYITSCSSTEALRMDVMETWDNTQIVIQCVTNWIFSNLKDLTEEDKGVLYDTVTFCIGGGFQYACMKLAKKEAVDVDRIVGQCMDFMVNAMGFDPAVFKLRKEISPEWLEATAKEVDRLTFGGAN